MPNQQSNPSSTTISLPATTNAGPRLGRDWVTKTDLVRFIRCPYAFLQVDRGLLLPEELIDPISAQLIDDGDDFHEQVIAVAAPLPEDLDLEVALASEATLLALPLLRNPGLKLMGAPDGVHAASGALLPIEIKSHKEVRRTDLLELAFYWLVLEPYRTRHDVTPRGELLLRRDGEAEAVPVEIEDRHFDEVRDLVKQIRRARRHGVKPRVCRCAACRGPLDEQVRHMTAEGKDLTMIWGVGRRYAAALEALGIAEHDELMHADPEAIVAGLREQRLYVSVGQVEQWCQHARAYQETRAVVFGPPAPVDDSFIAIDLEYDVFQSHVWLIGVLTSDDGRHETTFLWADTPADERRNLLALRELLDAHPNLPVLTWGGVMADLPQIQSACLRHRLGDTLAPLADRHVDLFMHAARSLRLPTPTLSLNGVGGYFGIPKMSEIADGFEAQAMFARYLRTKDAGRKQEIRRALLDYNRDDLELLVGAHDAIRSLQRSCSSGLQ